MIRRALSETGAARPTPSRRSGALHSMTDLEQISWSRRGLFGLAAATPLLLLASLGAKARAQDAAVCVNLDALPASQKSMRRSLGFKPQAPDPKKRCGNCAFFTASAGGCGQCQLLSGGAVAATNVCDNWAAKS